MTLCVSLTVRVCARKEASGAGKHTLGIPVVLSPEQCALWFSFTREVALSGVKAGIEAKGVRVVGWSGSELVGLEQK